ncbi:DUF2442 domain-containing protein [Cylindrospermopsis raciborskii]|nr:DUF2442 domain-containing protein [Cylindrospermopsis raciborskii]
MNSTNESKSLITREKENIILQPEVISSGNWNKHMFLHIVSAEHLDGYKIKIKFNDNRSGIVDLGDSLNGKVFKPLQNLDIFQQFEVDPQSKTIRWSNGADFAPEYLYFLAFRHLPELQAQFEKWGYLPDKVSITCELITS